MRKLATIRQVSNIRPIEGKDLIEQVNIDGWNVIVKKGEFQEGDLCVYVEIDSLLPPKPEFEFLARKKYIIKTMKMSGVRSEGIVFGLDVLGNKKAKLGDDVTDLLGIKQYNREDEPQEKVSRSSNLLFFIDKALRRFKFYRQLFPKQRKRSSGNFPHWIRKTDETRIQNKPWVLKSSDAWIATEKLDGSSATFGFRKGAWDSEYVVCSRNLVVTDENASWQVISKRHNMEEVLKELFKVFKAKDSIVIQGEIIGPNIQKNKYQLKDLDFYAFNVIIDGKSKQIYDTNMEDELRVRGIKVVPFVEEIDLRNYTVDSLLDLATFKSKLNGTTQAEGLVVRLADEACNIMDSFKAISPTFLIKNDE